MRLTVPVLAALTLALGGCGGGEEIEPPDVEPETADRPASLPDSWDRVVDRRAGFSIGVPPGWEHRDAPRGQRLVGPDGVTVVQVSADRTEGALEADLDAFAAAVAEQVEGFTEVEIGEPEPFSSRYPAVRVSARGRTDAGLQQIDVIVMRRPDVVAFPVTAFRSAVPGTDAIGDAALARLLWTVRNRPPEVLRPPPETNPPDLT